MHRLALLLLIGCGDNLEGVTLEHRQASEIAARCEQLTRCGLFDDEATCIAFIRPKDEAALFAAVADGTITYRPTSESACIRDLAGISCDQTAQDNRVVPLSCRGALVGTRAPGAECAFDDECSTGRCATSTCDPSQCCMGTCEPARNQIGLACVTPDDCVEGSFCANGQCVGLQKSGETCMVDSSCDFGLACVSGACRKLPALGESCPYDRCASINARCVSGSCVAVGLPGDRCTSDADCSRYAQCDAMAGICIDVPTLGMPCSGRCAGGARCANGECGPPLENGEPCTGYSECESQFCAEGPIFDVCVASPVCY